MQEISALNIYDILEPCYHGSGSKITTVTSRLPQSFRKLGETDRPLPVRTRMFGRAWPLRASVRDGIVPTWPQLLNSGNVPCTVSTLLLYMLVPAIVFSQSHRVRTPYYASFLKKFN